MDSITTDTQILTYWLCTFELKDKIFTHLLTYLMHVTIKNWNTVKSSRFETILIQDQKQL